MKTADAFQRPPTAQEAVLAELRRGILQRELKPGSQILQDAVAAELGVSRVPVREALKILEGEGHITYSPHRGYFVARLTYHELSEIYRIRELLEAEAVAVGLPRFCNEDAARMQTAIDLMAASHNKQDIRKLTTANKDFHFTLIESCGRQHLVRIIRQLWDSTDPYRSLYYTDSAHVDRVNKEHSRILEAARCGELAKLIELLNEHRNNAMASLNALLQES
jgi:DNA-binding GntR family transcriptional regulator